VGAQSPKGDGRWGHADLTGNVSEWVLDSQATYVVPCTDCSFLPASAPDRHTRGGGFGNDKLAVITAMRVNFQPTNRNASYSGIRCARVP